MPTYSYKAVDQSGKSIQGSLVAESQQVALSLLGEQSLFPIEVREGSEGRGVSMFSRRRRVRLRHLTILYGQLADLLRAGVPILRSLDVLSRQSSHPVLSGVVREIREDVAGGMTLADAMAKHPRCFSELQISMIRAGERGGFLEDVLSRIAVFLERQDELRNKLIGSMIYPALLVLIGGGLLIVLLTFIVPQLRPFIEQAKPNVLTHIVFAACDVLRDYGVALAIGTFMIAMMPALLIKTQRGREKIDLWKLKSPVLGKTLVTIALCRFCRILGTLLVSGVPILQALKIARDSAGNEILAKEIDRAYESVQKGGTVSEPLSHCALFPADVVDMIAVAEESNNLEKVLVQIADTNEIRTARMIDMGVRLIEPILLTVLAGMIAVIAVALLVPILTMSSNMKVF